MALNDAAYLHHSVKKLQMHQDVKAIVLVTHTVPNPVLVNHDLELFGHYRMNTTGNQHLNLCLESDSENKIKAWCFGHVHKEHDEVIDGIRYICHPRGREDEKIGEIYFPKLIQF